jgi:hypothetical protein
MVCENVNSDVGKFTIQEIIDSSVMNAADGSMCPLRRVGYAEVVNMFSCIKALFNLPLGKSHLLVVAREQNKQFIRLMNGFALGMDHDRIIMSADLSEPAKVIMMAVMSVMKEDDLIRLKTMAHMPMWNGNEYAYSFKTHLNLAYCSNAYTRGQEAPRLQLETHWITECLDEEVEYELYDLQYYKTCGFSHETRITIELDTNGTVVDRCEYSRAAVLFKMRNIQKNE